MSIFLWILQVLLAFHTIIGALWKFSHSDQVAVSLNAIPPGAWTAISVFELVCALCLILPAFKRRRAILAPIAAAFIAAEMLAFCGVHLASGDADSSPMIYWLVVAAISAFIAFGRFALRPIGTSTK